jgi:hypothetical protein
MKDNRRSRIIPPIKKEVFYELDTLNEEIYQRFIRPQSVCFLKHIIPGELNFSRQFYLGC